MKFENEVQVALIIEIVGIIVFGTLMEWRSSFDSIWIRAAMASVAFGIFVLSSCWAFLIYKKHSN
jgi:hypothetical protein